MFEVGNKVGTRSISELVLVESDASVGVVEPSIIVVINNSEDSFNVFFGEAGDTGEIVSIRSNGVF